MCISCYLKLIKFTRAQVKLTWAQALVGPGVTVDTPLMQIDLHAYIYVLMYSWWYSVTSIYSYCAYCTYNCVYIAMLILTMHGIMLIALYLQLWKEEKKHALHTHVEMYDK